MLVSCQKAQTLKIVAWEDYLTHSVQKKFKKIIKKKYGVELNIEIIPPGNNDNINKLLSDRSAHIFQLAHFLIHDKRFNIFQDKKILSLDLKKIDNFNRISPQLSKLSFNKYNSNTYALPLGHYLYRLAFNSDRVSSPKSWKSLINDKSKKKISISNYHIDSNIYLSVLMSNSQFESMNLTNHNLYPKAYIKTLKSLKENSSNLWDETEPKKLDNSLHYAAVLGSSINEDNSNWKFATPKEGAIGSIDYFALSSSLKENRELLDIAYEWLNFSLSNFYQVEVIANTVGDMPVIKDIDKELAPYQKRRFNIGELKIHYPSARTLKEEIWQQEIWSKL